jgi:hypothetical protein
MAIATVIQEILVTHHLKAPDRPIPVLQLRYQHLKCLRLEGLLPRKLSHVFYIEEVSTTVTAPVINEHTEQP